MRKYLRISENCRIFASEKETNNKLNPKTRKGTEIMKTIKFNECKSYEDIENTINEALKYDTVVENDSEAEKFFAEAGFEGEVFHNVIISTSVSIWNEEYNGEEVYNVVVKEHYTDSGSVDYVYSYSIC